MSDAREALLAQVITYFAQNGVRDTSLRTLAAAIGTSQRMLHYHFGSRADVLEAVIDAIAGQQAAQIAELFSSQDDPFDAGRRNWEVTAEGAQTFGPLWFELAAHAMHGEPYADRLRQVMVEAQLREFTRIYETRVPADRAASLARLTLGVGQGLLFSLLIDGKRAEADAALETFTGLVRRELARLPAEEA